MFLFSWKKIYKKSGGSVNTIFMIFEMLAKGSIPKNKYDPIYRYYDEDYSGQSFLVNIDDLLENAFRYTRKEVVEYIVLASYRPYSDYLMHGVTTLNVINSALPIDKLKQNRLLHIQDGEIHFHYEEVTKRGK